MALGWITLKSGDRISVFRSSPFFAVHFACIAAFFLKYHWEVDITFYVLRVLSRFRNVWDLREPPRHIMLGAEPAS